MKKLALALAASALCALSAPAVSASTIETPEAKATAASAADIARADMYAVFGDKTLKPGQYLWAKGSGNGPTRVIISLSEQMAYVYRGDDLVGVATLSSGTEKHPTPTGIFPIQEKKTMHRSRKYDNAPMPHMQRLDQYGIALHAGHNPGHPASHGCIRLPSAFAAKLYTMTQIGTPVLIGA